MRITNAMLDQLIDHLNKITGNNLKPWERVDGRNKANIGNYHLSGAYGGVSLHKMVNESGGIRDVFSCGHVPKRDLYNRINSYIAGIECEEA